MPCPTRWTRAAPRSGRSWPTWSRWACSTHPHTSAGRVPTDSGYRYYVDALMEANPGKRRRSRPSKGYGNVDELLRGVSEGMSEVTRLLAVVAGPSAAGRVARPRRLSAAGRRQAPARRLDGERRLFERRGHAAHPRRGGRTARDLRRPQLLARGTTARHRPGAWLAARTALSDHDPMTVGAVLEAVEAPGKGHRARRVHPGRLGLPRRAWTTSTPAAWRP